MIVAGFGFRENATVDSLTAALSMTGVGHVDAVASAPDKCESAVFRDFAATLPAAVIAVAPGDMTAVETPTQSDASQKARGTGSVAEAAALIAAGSNARLTTHRQISPDGRATCAIAEGEVT